MRTVPPLHDLLKSLEDTIQFTWTHRTVYEMFYRYGQVQHLNSREKTSLLGRLIEKYRVCSFKKTDQNTIY